MDQQRGHPYEQLTPDVELERISTADGALVDLPSKYPTNSDTPTAASNLSDSEANYLHDGKVDEQLTPVARPSIDPSPSKKLA
ncbi:hypothetical protein F5B22DRAFT_618850 [Xylaria bambusicola]|uniref:uncharacterized protein n=1 Tax=Xylaria bambusicola TaxID=326684 RepID=UPI0020083CF8|nr:uncharacterized protein F5B22DRAFT_618850 [Xylaria bambusicola]KAI0509016.1 hypothetical protein F5B22DRAFT_618850 [Xylaria bambusicola]